MKSIASIPGALLFRWVAVVLIMSVLYVIFFSYTDSLDSTIKQVNRNRVITEINIALAVKVHQLTLRGQLDELVQVDQSNPFEFLSGKDYKIPASYQGTVKREGSFDRDGWYFNENAKQILYVENYVVEQRFKLLFEFKDANSNGIFEKEFDQVTNFGLIKM